MEEHLTTLQLARETQKPSEGILTYIKRFHGSAMECYEPVEEIQLVKICLDGMQPDYKLLLINLFIYQPSLSCLRVLEIWETRCICHSRVHIGVVGAVRLPMSSTKEVHMGTKGDACTTTHPTATL